MAVKKSGMEWFELLGRFKSSGLSEEDFSSQEGISLKQFKYWKDRLNKEKNNDRSKPRSNIKRNLTQWREIVKRYRLWQGTPYSFCEQEGIRLTQLEYWKERVDYAEARGFFNHIDEQTQSSQNNEPPNSSTPPLNQTEQNAEPPDTSNISDESTLPNNIRDQQSSLNRNEPPRGQNRRNVILDALVQLKKELVKIGQIFGDGIHKLSTVTKTFAQDRISDLKKLLVKGIFQFPGLKQLDALFKNSMSNKIISGIQERKEERHKSVEYAERYLKYDPRAQEEMQNGKSRRKVFKEASQRFSDILKLEKLIEKVESEIKHNERYSIDTTTLVEKKAKLIEKISELDKHYATQHHNVNILRDKNQLSIIDRILNQVTGVGKANRERVDYQLIMEEEIKKVTEKSVALMTSKEIRKEIHEQGLGSIGDQDIRQLRKILIDHLTEEAKKLVIEPTHQRNTNPRPNHGRNNIEEVREQNSDPTPIQNTGNQDIQSGERTTESNREQGENRTQETRQSKLLEEIRNILFKTGNATSKLGSSILSGITTALGIGGGIGSGLLKPSILGKMGAVGLAGAAGVYTGGEIYDNMSEESRDTVGSAVARVGSWFGLNENPDEHRKRINKFESQQREESSKSKSNRDFMGDLPPGLKLEPKKEQESLTSKFIKNIVPGMTGINAGLDLMTNKPEPVKSPKLDTMKVMDNLPKPENKSQPPVIINAPTTNTTTGGGINIPKDDSIRPRENSFTKYVDKKYI